MKKAIIIASVASMIDQFNRDNINLLQELGYEVSVACNFEYGSSISNEQVKKLINDLNNLKVRYYHVPIPRSIFNIMNMIKSYSFLKKMSLEKQYDLMHCHSPIGGVLARLAFKKARKNGTRVIYTAHGFHFYDGAPLKNWLIFYPIEKYCSRLTDCLITINKEDYKRALKFHVNDIEYLHGIGVNTNKFFLNNSDIKRKRKEFNIDNDDIVLFSVGELNENKNHEIVIRSIASLKIDKIHYLIAGKGEKEEHLNILATRLGVNVHLLGYRTDMSELYNIADIFVLPSYREGLSVSLMEAMASSLPCILSKIRGNMDLIENGNGGYLCDPHSIGEFSRCIRILANNKKLRVNYGMRNKKYIEKYDVKEVMERTKVIYLKIDNNKESK